MTNLADEYRERGRKLLPKSKWAVWDAIIADSAKGIYGGMDLRCVLELLPLAHDIPRARIVFNQQGHSGASAVLVCNELHKLLDDRAEPFVRAIYG